MAKKAEPTSAYKADRSFNWFAMLLFATAFQLLSMISVVFVDDVMNEEILWVFAGFMALEWAYFLFARSAAKQRSTQMELIAFLLSGIGLTTVASVCPENIIKQFIAIVLGLATFIILLFVLRSTDFAMAMRWPVAVGAVGLLGVNLVLAETINGALNWISLGAFSFQPSELVKVAFIFVGASTLEKLQSTRSLTKYLVFAMGCVGALFLMKDFGTALIFFATFVVIAFMRSGDIRTIFFVCTAALMGAILVIMFKPHVASRFEVYRHVWEDYNGVGFQQSRVLIYSASGGLFGLGIGEGRLRGVYASTTDLVFGVLCEEWGMLAAFAIIICFAFIAVYALRCARNARSTFYSIAAVSAAAMILVQLSLNVFGITDLLPLTGVTLPFISRGGTSMICSWALLAFIKSADLNTYPKLKREAEVTQ